MINEKERVGEQTIAVITHIDGTKRIIDSNKKPWWRRLWRV